MPSIITFFSVITCWTKCPKTTCSNSCAVQSHVGPVECQLFDHAVVLFSLQDVPLAGVVRSFSGASAIVPALPQWGSARVWPEEADAGSPGWGNWCVC